MYEKLASVC